MGTRFNYGKKEKDGYNPYSKVFTERQQRIIMGIPVDGLKIQESIWKVMRSGHW